MSVKPFKGLKTKVPKNIKTVKAIQSLHSECMIRFFNNVRYLMGVYGLTWEAMRLDTKRLGYTLHKSTLHRFKDSVFEVATLRYMLYYEHYFRFRFGCPVSVGEMLSFDLSNIQRYSKENLVK